MDTCVDSTMTFCVIHGLELSIVNVTSCVLSVSRLLWWCFWTAGCIFMSTKQCTAMSYWIIQHSLIFSFLISFFLLSFLSSLCFYSSFLPVEMHPPAGRGRSLSRLPFMSLGPAQRTSDTVAFVSFSHVMSHLFSQLHWKELPRKSLQQSNTHNLL